MSRWLKHVRQTTILCKFLRFLGKKSVRNLTETAQCRLQNGISYLEKNDCDAPGNVILGSELRGFYSEITDFGWLRFGIFRRGMHPLLRFVLKSVRFGQSLNLAQTCRANEYFVYFFAFFWKKKVLGISLKLPNAGSEMGFPFWKKMTAMHREA